LSSRTVDAYFGGLQYCDQKGLDVPNDIDIAGWGDLPISAVLKKTFNGCSSFSLESWSKSS
jgi:LacI family gluconate utilization system Gnt-I transcriptional repressor